jgi:putative membrane protein
MDRLFQIEFVYTAASYSVVVLATVLFLAIFETVTNYNNWEEIKRGNVSVALATGGKIFGVANIFRFSIQHNDSILTMLTWGAYGFTLLLFGYFIFEFLTPKFKVDEEIAQDNRAVGLLSFIISVGLSFVIGAGIIK